MAKPDLDDGWLKYAHELDAALAVGGFTKGARIVLREVFAQIFGPAKLRTARLSASDIARRSGAKRELFARAVKELVDARVLVPTEDGLYRFNKDYEAWLEADGRRPPSGAVRLTPVEVSYCRHAPAVALAYKHGLGELDRNHPVTPPVTNGLHPEESTVTNRLQKRNHPVTETVTNGLHPEASPPDPPNRNGRAEFENGELRRYGGGADTREPVAAGEPDGPVTFEAFVEAVAAEFGAKVAAYVRSNGADIIGEFSGRFDCYLAALRAAARQRQEPDNVHAWCLKVGRKFKRDGIPPEPGPLKAKAAPAADPYSKLLAEMEDE